MTVRTVPEESVTTVGHIEDSGRLPGAMRLAADHSKPKLFVAFSTEKSSMPLFITMPVDGEISIAPKLQEMYIVILGVEGNTWQHNTAE